MATPTIDSEKFTVADDGTAVFKVRYFADTRAEALYGIPKTHEGLTLKNGASNQWSPGKVQYIVDASYQGILDGENGGGDPGPEFDDFDLDTEQREEKIESFPNRALLVEQFGAYLDDGKLKFPPIMPEAVASGVSALATGGVVGGVIAAAQAFSAAGASNPFFNVTTYPVYYTVGQHGYTRKRVVRGFDALNGQVVTSLPPGFEYDGPGTKFQIRTRRSKQGNAWRHEATYRELDEFPHLEALNRLLQQANGVSGTASSVR